MSLTGYQDLPQQWLNLLVFVHVISAIVGIGPTFFMHVLLRKGQTYGKLRSSLSTLQLLEKFPKIVGSLAVITGLLLAWLGKFGFQKLWIYGAIIVYVIVQIVVIGFLAPIAKKLAPRVMGSPEAADQPLPQDIADQVKKADSLTYVASFFGILLFALMFFKPEI